MDEEVMEEVSEEDQLEEEENDEKVKHKKKRPNWGYNTGEKIFYQDNLRFKPFTTAVTEQEKYADAIALTGNLYQKQFMELLSQRVWIMRYYEKPFHEYCVQGMFLKGISSIEMTDIDVNYDLIYHIVENVQILGNITLLRFRNCNLMDEELKILCPRLADAYVLHDLDLSHNHIGDDGLFLIVKNLQNCASLRRLNLFDTGITPVGLEKFGNVYAKQRILLTKLNIGSNPLNNANSVRKFLSGIVKRSAPLQDLLMANCTLQGAEMASNFEASLSLSDHLRYLDVSFNLFSSEEELLSLITLFARSASLKELVLNFNPICDNVLTSMLDTLFEYPELEPRKSLYLENMTMPQLYFKEKWNSFNRTDLKITSAGVRRIKVPKTDSYKCKLVKRFNFLYKKRKPKRDIVVSSLTENLPKSLKKIKVDDFKDALMAIGKIDFLLIQEIVNEFSGGGSRANVKEFVDIYNELYPPKPKTPKKAAVDKNKKKKRSTNSGRLSEAVAPPPEQVTDEQ